ncbi:hypothetical protein [Sulfurimonas indica]|uniref:hypothetical protein n=1 Tax=Sulfurimonas indica TaxID=2508707 RepID=UPI0012655225|nr:hypothetical protein [Sulfurimonas indica]
MKKHSTVMSELLEISENSYFRWKKKDHIVLIDLIETYFSTEDLIEFLNTGKIEKYEQLNFFNLVKKKNINKYLSSFLQDGRYDRLSLSHDIFIDFYFQFLLFVKNQSYFTSLDLLIQKHLLSYCLYTYQPSIIEDEFEKDYTNDKNELQNILNSLNKIINEDIINRIQPHFCIFQSWDDYMLITLQDIIDNHMFDLFDCEDNEITRKEALYHIIGYHVYSNIDNKLNFNEKISLISKIFSNLSSTIFKNKEELFQQLNSLQLKYLAEIT